MTVEIIKNGQMIVRDAMSVLYIFYLVKILTNLHKKHIYLVINGCST